MTEQEITKQNGLAMIAWSEGKPVQWCPKTSLDAWKDCGAHGPIWEFPITNYRPKPQPTLVPWSKPEHVPGPVCWVRWSGSMELLVTALSNHAIRLGGDYSTERDWSVFEKHSNPEYSLDRKTWHPCTVEVSE